MREGGPGEPTPSLADTRPRAVMLSSAVECGGAFWRGLFHLGGLRWVSAGVEYTYPYLPLPLPLPTPTPTKKSDPFL